MMGPIHRGAIGHGLIGIGMALSAYEGRYTTDLFPEPVGASMWVAWVGASIATVYAGYTPSIRWAPYALMILHLLYAVTNVVPYFIDGIIDHDVTTPDLLNAVIRLFFHVGIAGALQGWILQHARTDALLAQQQALED